MESPLLLARNVAKMFQDLNRGHHKNLHAFIAAGAVAVTKFANDPAEYEQLKKEKFWADCGKKPRGAFTSKDVLIYLTGAITNDARRQAGKYAGAIDYMIAKKVNDYEAYLNRLGYEKILEAARSERPKGRAKGTPGPYIKVYMSPKEFEPLGLILANCPTEVTFALVCRAGPGHNAIATGYRTPVTKIDQFPEIELELNEYRKRHKRMVAAQNQLAKEAKSLASRSGRKNETSPPKARKP
jgi:hypothetical protein